MRVRYSRCLKSHPYLYAFDPFISLPILTFTLQSLVLRLYVSLSLKLSICPDKLRAQLLISIYSIIILSLTQVTGAKLDEKQRWLLQLQGLLT